MTRSGKKAPHIQYDLRYYAEGFSHGVRSRRILLHAQTLGGAKEEAKRRFPLHAPGDMLRLLGVVRSGTYTENRPVTVAEYVFPKGCTESDEVYWFRMVEEEAELLDGGVSRKRKRRMRTTIRIAVVALILASNSVSTGELIRRVKKDHAIRQHHRLNGHRHPPKRLGSAPQIWTDVQGIRDVIDGNYRDALDPQPVEDRQNGTGKGRNWGTQATLRDGRRWRDMGNEGNVRGNDCDPFPRALTMNRGIGFFTGIGYNQPDNGLNPHTQHK